MAQIMYVCLYFLSALLAGYGFASAQSNLGLAQKGLNDKCYTQSPGPGEPWFTNRLIHVMKEKGDTSIVICYLMTERLPNGYSGTFQMQTSVASTRTANLSFMYVRGPWRLDLQTREFNWCEFWPGRNEPECHCKRDRLVGRIKLDGTSTKSDGHSIDQIPKEDVCTKSSSILASGILLAHKPN